MGAQTFVQVVTGKTPKEAFEQAVRDAQYEYGHGGYTGTIAEKRGFVMIDKPTDVSPGDFVQELFDIGDPRIDDKWGPAGCIRLSDNRFCFFGWASS